MGKLINNTRVSTDLLTGSNYATNSRISEIKRQLTKLSEDMIQEAVGEVVPNITDKKAQFITLHNELRVLEGKEPRTTL